MSIHLADIHHGTFAAEEEYFFKENKRLAAALRQRNAAAATGDSNHTAEEDRTSAGLHGDLTEDGGVSGCNRYGCRWQPLAAPSQS